MDNLFNKILLIPWFLILINQSFAQYWQKIENIPAPFTNNYWLDVYFHPSNPNYGWICGFNGMIIRTTDGGNTWRGSTVNAYHLESVHFPTLQIGYVSGVEGIFKSTDGGVTWFDVTPAGTRDTTHFWGCFFLNENYGVLVGDGCYGRNQHFWLTTDGGTSWSLFLGTEDNTGMTDVMLYPNGLGYASSSGKLWITLDSGRTWQVFATVGPNLWQEEITNIGSSFLVPYSGTTCTGGGNDGGMRFTTNNGATWNSFRTGVPMFGTFLIDNQKGWACGYYREVYYTSNGGINWHRRNCGIESGNLDDLWFVDENNGWVVGEGVYKLSNPKGVTNKNSINFGEICVGLRKLDTLWIKNYNFNDVTISLSLNSPTGEFEIVSPGTTAYLPSCDSVRIIIAFIPKTSGSKNGTLQIQYPFQNPINIQLSGRASESSAKLVDTLIVITNAKCGFTYPISAKISVKGDGEFVSALIPNVENKIFKLVTQLPFQLDPQKTNFLNFEVTPNDTGWNEIIYRVRFSPCDTFQFLKIRVYAVSPIINLDSIVNIDLQCSIYPIKLRISNSGNDTLFIRKFSFSPQTNKLILSGWTSGRELLNNFILPGKDDTLIINVDSNFYGTISTILLIENNDFRLVGGQRNIVQVKINIRIFISKVSAIPDKIDFGKVCVGDTSNHSFTLLNNGNLEELILTVSQKNRQNFFIRNIFPLTIKSFDSLKVKISFYPNRIGKFFDTLEFVTLNCKDTIRLYCLGEGVKANINYQPKQIISQIQKGQSKKFALEFHNLSNDTLKLVGFYVSKEIEQFVSDYKILNDSILIPLDTLQLEFSFFATEKGRFTGNIFIHLKGICDTLIAISVQIVVVDKNLTFEPSYIDFGDILCDRNSNVRSLILKNMSEIPDTISNIVIIQKNFAFSLEDSPTLPIYLNPYDSLELRVKFTPILPGYDTAFVKFIFEDTTRNFLVPLTAFYGFSELKIEPNIIDFGKLEFCELPITKTCIVKNLGNIEDSIVVERNMQTGKFDFQVSKFSLSGNFNDSAIVYLTFGKQGEVGEFIDTLVVSFRKCLMYDTIIIKAEIVAPEYEIIPKVVDIGEVWVGTTKTGSIQIENKGLESFNVKISSMNTSTNLFLDKDFYSFVSPREVVTFQFQVVSSLEGEFWDTLCFEISSKCQYYDCVVIHYVIPKEEYSITLQIDKYQAKPGDDLEILVKNLTPNNFLKLDTLNLSVTFDKWLFYPSLCKIDGYNLDFKLAPGNIVLNLEKGFLMKFLNEGKPISIFGKVLYSYPDSTTLVLNVLSYWPNKNINFKLLDGLLKVFPVCQPIGSMRMELFPSFEIVGLNIGSSTTKILVESTDYQMVEILTFDIFGNYLATNILELSSGLNLIDFDYLLNKIQRNSEIFVILKNGFVNRFIFVPFLK